MKYLIVALVLIAGANAWNPKCIEAPGTVVCCRNRWYFDMKSQVPKQYNYGFGCCDQDKNSFSSKGACESQCFNKDGTMKWDDDCESPVGTKKCIRYYFDKKRARCVAYADGIGCCGEKNTFNSKKECEATCLVIREEPNKESSKTSKEQSSKTSKEQSSKTNRTSKTSKTSKEQSSSTNKTSKTSKEQSSSTNKGANTRNPKCMEKPGTVASCRNRWYFDQWSKTSKQYNYGLGCCGEDKNSFSSKGACESRCLNKDGTKRSDKDCESPVGTRKCIRYYFDKERARCVAYADGIGCFGEKNSFNSKKECEDTCLVIREEPSTESSSESKGKSSKTSKGMSSKSNKGKSSKTSKGKSKKKGKKGKSSKKNKGKSSKTSKGQSKNKGNKGKSSKTSKGQSKKTSKSMPSKTNNW